MTIEHIALLVSGLALITSTVALLRRGPRGYQGVSGPMGATGQCCREHR